MTDEDDFSSYAAARWGGVVRVGVLLGLPWSHAGSLAMVALARLRDGWGRDDGGDLDVTLYELLLEVVRTDHTPWWEHPEVGDPGLLSSSGLAEIEAALDRLDPVRRARLVLGAVARLTPEQVDDVLAVARGDGGGARGGAGGSTGPAPELVGFVADAVVVAPYPHDEVRRAAGGRRHRRRLLEMIAAATGLVLLVAGVLLVVRELRDATGLTPTSTSSPTSSPASTPASVGPSPTFPDLVITAMGVPVAWSARDRLHLVGRLVPLDGVVALATIPDGVVAALDDGRLVSVAVDGEVLDIGRVRPGERFATEPAEGLVAWIDVPDSLGRRAVIVRDVPAGEDLVRLPVAADAQVVAVDNGLTYVSDARGYSVVRPGTSLVDRHEGVTLLDVASGTRATAPRPGLVRLQRDGGAPLNVTGVDVVLSDDGRYALLKEPPGAGTRSAYAVVDVQMGTLIELALPDEGTAVDAAFSVADSAREVVFVIARRAAAYDLIACDLRFVSCRIADRVLRTAPRPLLAR